MLDKVLQETITWETKPINELLGSTATNGADYSKQIIMYGPTQVGKTTLILDLMGAKSDQREDLDKILKGGAKAGSASTSSAIIYSKWNRDIFGLATQNIHDSEPGELQELTADEFKEKIKIINEQDRASDGLSTKTSDIYCYYIPQYFFDDSATLQNLQIIDLPGFGERNEKMRKRADEIVSFISQIVAGAIVVIKSENIQKLESDYKDFISKHHFNHLAIAISYAASTDNNVKNIDTKDLSDDQLASNISKYYYDLIQSEQYLNLESVTADEIVFPVEKKIYLQKNVQHLTGAFDVIRKRLINRVATMCNQTSIKFCIEKLEHKNQIIQQEKEAIKKTLEEDIEEEKRLQMQMMDAKQKKQKNDDELHRVKERIDLLQKRRNEILMCASNLRKTKYSPSQAEELWNTVKDYKKSDRNEYLNKVLIKFVHQCIGDEPTKEKRFYKAAEKAAGKHLTNFDFEEFFRPRHLSHRQKWREEAAFEINCFLEKITGDVEKSVNIKNFPVFQKISDKKISLENKVDDFNMVLRELDKRIEQNHTAQKQKRNFIEETENDIKNNLIHKENVKKVFIKHFYLKKQELEQRIICEPDSEIKTALFLVLSSIYLNMKPYLEENENE